MTELEQKYLGKKIKVISIDGMEHSILTGCKGIITAAGVDECGEVIDVCLDTRYGKFDGKLYIEDDEFEILED